MFSSGALVELRINGVVTSNMLAGGGSENVTFLEGFYSESFVAW